MAPKKEQSPAVTPATVASSLSGTDAQQLQALNQLAVASTFTQAEVLDCGIPAKLASLLQQPDKSVKLLACRQLAIYAASSGELQQALMTINTLEALWALLNAYHAAEAAVAAGLADPTAAKAAQPKKLQPVKDLIDPDDWLPGPSKYLLDAALRAICSIINPDDTKANAETDLLEDLATAIAADRNRECSANALLSWAAQQDVRVLVCLLRHPSARIQMRACRLAHQLSTIPAWAESFAAAGGAAAAVRLASAPALSTAAVHLKALHLLQRLAEVSSIAAAVMFKEPKQLADALVLLLLEAGSNNTAVIQQGKGKQPAGAADATKQVNAEATHAQLAAADLLSMLCAQSSSVSQYIGKSGALAALQALLPDAPAPDLTAEEAAAVHSGTADTAEAEPKATPRKASASRQQTPRGADTAKQSPPRTPTTGDAAKPTQTPRGPGIPSRTPQPPGTPTTAEPAADGSAGAAAEAPFEFPLPAVKNTNPELQSRVLHVIAAVLSHQGAVQTIPGLVGLVRMLLHMFAPAPAPPQNFAEAFDSADAAEPATNAAAPAATGSKAAAAARAAAATVPAAATAGKGATASTRKSAIGAAAEATAATAAGTATPRKGATAPAGGAAAKESQKVAEPLVPIHDPLAPPYSVLAKAAALQCLAQLAQDKQAVTLMTAQRIQAHHQPSPEQMSRQATSSGSAPGAVPPQAPSDAVMLEQQQQQQQLNNDSGLPMLRFLLDDLQLMTYTPTDALSACGTASSSGSNSAGVLQQNDAVASKSGVGSQPRPTSMLEGAAGVLAGLAKNLEKQQLVELQLLPALKAVARCSCDPQVSLHVQQAVARALLLIPEEAYVPPAKPPLPSPPATPPPPPLPTSQFAWDALDRPYITDGAVVVSSA